MNEKQHVQDILDILREYNEENKTYYMLICYNNPS